MQRWFGERTARYLCKDCNHRYTVAQRSGVGDKTVKRQALELYLEGLRFRSIGRALGFSHVTILNWIRAFGEQLDAIKNDDAVQVVELDEMHSYVGSKKTIAGQGLLLIDMEKGFSAAYWVPGRLAREKSSGKPVGQVMTYTGRLTRPSSPRGGTRSQIPIGHKGRNLYCPRS